MDSRRTIIPRRERQPAPPSAEAKRELACNSFDPESSKSRRQGSGECLRLDEKGRAMDARYRLVSRDSIYAKRSTDDQGSGDWGQWREPGAYALGSGGHSGGWSRDWFGGWQTQRRGFWNW